MQWSVEDRLTTIMQWSVEDMICHVKYDHAMVGGRHDLPCENTIMQWSVGDRLTTLMQWSVEDMICHVQIGSCNGRWKT